MRSKTELEQLAKRLLWYADWAEREIFVRVPGGLEYDLRTAAESLEEMSKENENIFSQKGRRKKRKEQKTKTEKNRWSEMSRDKLEKFDEILVDLCLVIGIVVAILCVVCLILRLFTTS